MKLEKVRGYIQDLLSDNAQSRYEAFEEVRRNFSAVVDCLRHNTGEGKKISITPEKGQRDPWWDLQAGIASFDRSLAETVVRHWYQTILDEQKQNKRRYHKGTPLIRVAEFNFWRRNLSKARRYASLAMIEDVFSKPGGYRSLPAWSFLCHSLRIPEKELEGLAAFVKTSAKRGKNKPENRSPERLLADFLSDDDYFKVRETERELFDVNPSLAEELFQRIGKARSPKTKGLAFEKLAEYLFFSVEGFEVHRKRLRTKDYEIDLVIRNAIDTDVIFEEFGRYLLVECKNWETPVGVPEVTKFLAKIRFHNCRTGVLFSKTGISGQRDENEFRYANLTILKAFHNDRVIIIVIDENDLESIVKGDDNLLSVLLKNYEKVRFGQL